MYLKPFYITEAVGNNKFSFEKRSEKKIFIPSLKQIDNFDQIQFGDKIAFEDYDINGKLSSNKGLKNFYKLVSKQLKNIGINGDIYIFDNHNHAYYFWFLARNNGIINDKSTLYHIDEHSDFKDDGEYLLKPESLDLKKIFDFTNYVLNVGNYIIPALKEGIIQKVIQIRNETNLENYLEANKNSINIDAPDKNNSIILNIDLDFFQPELDYIDFDLKKKVILDLAKKANLITISSSPFFIEQAFAIKQLKKLFV